MLITNTYVHTLHCQKDHNNIKADVTREGVTRDAPICRCGTGSFEHMLTDKVQVHLFYLLIHVYVEMYLLCFCLIMG